jgi:hypothetical protein
MIQFFGYGFDLDLLRIPVGVAIAVVAIVLLFVVGSKIFKVILALIGIIALGLVAWWALNQYGIL